MKPIHVLAVVVLIAGGATAGAASPDCTVTLSPRDDKAIRAVIEAYRTSWLAGDAKGVQDTFTSDAVLLPAHGAPPVAGMDEIKKYWWPAGAPPTTITRLDVTIEGLEGDGQVAYVHGHDTVAWTMVEDGKTTEHGHPGTYLNVMRKQKDGTWRIARHMWDDGQR